MSWRTVATLDAGIVSTSTDGWDIFPVGDIVGSGNDSRILSFSTLCDGQFGLSLTYNIPTNEYTAIGTVSINGVVQSPVLMSNSGGSPDSGTYYYNNGDVITLEGAYDINDYGGSYFVNLTITAQECYGGTTPYPTTPPPSSTTPPPSSTTTPPPSSTTTPPPSSTTTPPPSSTTTTPLPTPPQPPLPNFNCTPCYPPIPTTPEFPPTFTLPTTKTAQPIFILTTTPPPVNPLNTAITITTTTTQTTQTTQTQTTPPPLIIPKLKDCNIGCNTLNF